MDRKKLITICQSGGSFQMEEDDSLSYNGGEAHAIDIDHETRFEDYLVEIAEVSNCISGSVSIKYFLRGNRKTLINISNDKDLQRMISFNGDSSPVHVYVIPNDIVMHDVSNMPASRSSRTTLTKTVVPVEEFHENQRFRSVQEFREALHKYAITNSVAYKYVKSDFRRVTVRCKWESCPWRIHASKLATTQLFYIRKMNATHTCEGGDMTSGSHATIKWVAGIVKEKLREPPYCKPKDIVNEIKREYGIEVNYYQAWRGKEIAREQLQGSFEEAYSQLPGLCERILESNPGSFATFATKPDSSFHRLFIAHNASVHGFQEGCRPLLFLDDAPLNSKYQGTLLVATAVDGDDGVLPVAFAIVDAETEDNWKWFLMELKSAVSTSRPITFVAGMQEGLKDSIPEVFENSYHAYCLDSLTESFKTGLQTHFSNEVRRLLVEDFHAAARAFKLEEFQRCTESIKSISLEAYNWILQSKPENWANACLLGARYNHLNSNFGHLFYSWLSEAHDLTITQMADLIQCKMMESIDKCRMDSDQWATRLTPSMEEKLHKETLNVHSLEVVIPPDEGTDGTFEVRGYSIEKVDINQWICSCRGWQITGLPCFHAIAVCQCIDRSPYDFCSRYFTTENYRIAYLKSINPVPDVVKNMQNESSQAIVKVTPPPIRRTSGRPKVNKSGSKGWAKRSFQCSKCKGVGHNKLHCKASV